MDHAVSKEKASIAIIIGVQVYGGGLQELPSCSKDGAAMLKILESTGRFKPEHILVVIGNVTSDKLKPRLASFIASKTDLDVDELFFFFSGHGDYTGSEFYYLLSDYESKNLRQRSLENFELDNLARSLRPGLYIKVVDACHSGLRYVKSKEDFDAYATKSAGSFERLYFMFSSLSDQYSYGGANLSRFTRSVVQSISSSDKNEIRYKDIIDVVSDDMSSGSQTPYFVIQAQFTEVFCQPSAELKADLKIFLGSSEPATLTHGKDVAFDIVELVRRDAERYASKDEALAVIEGIPEILQQYMFSDFLLNFYDFTINSFGGSFAQMTEIGAWLENNNSTYQIFAKPTYQTETRKKRVRSNSMMSVLNPLASDYKEIDESFEIINGYDNTVDFSYRYVSVRANEKFPNVDQARCLIVPLFSKTELLIFSGFHFYDNIDWEKKKMRGKIIWQSKIVDLKSDLNALLREIMGEYGSFLELSLKDKWSAGAPIIQEASEARKKPETE